MRARNSTGFAMALSAILALAACGSFAYVFRTVSDQRWRDAEATLRAEVLVLADGVGGELRSGDPQATQRRVQALGNSTGIRITLIRADGTVLADSEANPATMDNLGARPEVVASLASDFGSSRRLSPTLGVDSLFVAKAVRQGSELEGWIRASVTSAWISSGITGVQWSLVLTGAMAAAAALALGVLAVRLWRIPRARS